MLKTKRPVVVPSSCAVVIEITSLTYRGSSTISASFPPCGECRAPSRACSVFLFAAVMKYKYGGGDSHAGGLRHRRRRLGRLRSSKSAERGSRHPRRADRSGRTRPEPADPYSGRLHEAARPSNPDLGI